MTPFLHKVALGLAHARAKHPAYNSAHEAYAIIKEELDEFWDLVKLQTNERDPELMLAELIHIAVTAARAAEDLGLIAPTYDVPFLFRLEQEQ